MQEMILPRWLVLLIFLPIVSLGITACSNGDPEFDKFVEDMIRRLGASHEPIDTRELLQFLTDKGVEDPIGFLESRMQVFGRNTLLPKKNMSDSTKRIVQEFGAERYTGFSREYFNWGIFYHEFVVFVYEKDEEFVHLEAYIFYHSF